MDERHDPWIEELLTRSRPTGEVRWERELERSLVQSRARPRLARRPAAVGAALGAAVALSLFIAGLLGGGPLSPSGSEPVRANDDCRWVRVVEPREVRTVEVGRDGRPRVVTRTERVTRRVKRCR